MFAKHQSEEAKKFRVDKRGNIVGRRHLPPNKKGRAFHSLSLKGGNREVITLKTRKTKTKANLPP